MFEFKLTGVENTFFRDRSALVLYFQFCAVKYFSTKHSLHNIKVLIWQL